MKAKQIEILIFKVISNQHLMISRLNIFSYDEEDGTWCGGEVVSIVNERTRMVMIKWNKEKVVEGDALESKHKLLVSRWNPRIARMGAWTAFVGE